MIGKEYAMERDDRRINQAELRHKASRVKKRVLERVSPGVMHIIQSETLGGPLARLFSVKSLANSLAESLANIILSCKNR